MRKLIVIIVLLCNKTIFTKDLDLNYLNLCEHLKKYKTTNIEWHAGDLFEHTVWVTQIVENWFYKKKIWIEGLEDEDRRIAMLCGFLHDIGKAGDLIFTYKEKPSHPQDGFEYFLNKKPFLIDESHAFDFDDWCSYNHISDEERKFIAIIIAIHWDFGLVIKRVRDGENEALVFDHYIERLEEFAIQANYNNGKVTKKLLLLSILINAADVKGLHSTHCCCSNSFNLPVLDECRKAPLKAYEVHGHKTIGKEIRQRLISYFDQTYT